MATFDEFLQNASREVGNVCSYHTEGEDALQEAWGAGHDEGEGDADERVRVMRENVEKEVDTHYLGGRYELACEVMVHVAELLEAASYLKGPHSQETRAYLNALREMLLEDENAPPSNWNGKDKPDRRIAA